MDGALVMPRQGISTSGTVGWRCFNFWKTTPLGENIWVSGTGEKACLTQRESRAPGGAYGVCSPNLALGLGVSAMVEEGRRRPGLTEGLGRDFLLLERAKLLSRPEREVQYRGAGLFPTCPSW